ncbi:MAG: hypothetical protein ACJARS_003274, partial [bacterium]
SWPYVGYHSDWKSLRLVRDGSVLEFFIDGVSQGTRTAPSTGPGMPRTLYLSSSTNGGQGAYSAGQRLTERSQMDNIRSSLIRGKIIVEWSLAIGSLG